jgi:hypothetical protein
LSHPVERVDPPLRDFRPVRRVNTSTEENGMTAIVYSLRRYTGLTCPVAYFSVNGFTHLRLLRRNPF